MQRNIKINQFQQQKLQLYIYLHSKVSLHYQNLKLYSISQSFKFIISKQIQMYRTSALNLNNTSSFQNYQSRANSSSKTATQFNQSRIPLYPVGPTIIQQQFNPMRRNPSPYVSSIQGIKPPSYQQRFLRTDTNFMIAEKGGVERMFNNQQRERKLIQRNQIEIKEQQKRRQNLMQSYERQIQNLSRLLHKNLDRKQKILLEIETLEKTNEEYREKLNSVVPPKRKVDYFEPLDRKHQDIIITKNKLLSDIRQKEQTYLKQQEQQEQYWESQFKQKEKILFRSDEDLKNKRIELLNTRIILEKPDFIAIQDEVREQKYQDFLYDAKILQEKIQNLIKEREQQQREVDQCIRTKSQNIHSLLLRHQEKSRESATSKLRTDQLERVSKEMESANQNLMHEIQRKDNMIEKFQIDIHNLKERKDKQESSVTSMMRAARQNQIQQQMEKDIQSQILHMQDVIRTQSSINNNLKTQYQKLYEILCSTVSKNVRETFKETLAA